MVQMAKLSLGNEEKEAVNNVIDSGMIACGEVVKEFENAFAQYCGAAYGIATTSGTTALEVALRALGLGNGDKILTTPYSFIASTNPIIYVGATPVYADIDPDTFNLDLDTVEKVLSEEKDIKALLIVHLFGRPCDMDRLKSIVNKYKLFLIEDCAQAHGATWNGKRVGSFGDVSAFSFYPTKNMTTGEGGIILTSNSEIAEKARMMINHGMKVRYYHDVIGYNYRMTNIAAAIGLCQLNKLPAMNKRRYANAQFYNGHINNPLIRQPGLIEGHVYHQYTLQIDNGLRDAFVEHLTNNDIGFGVFYPLSIPEQKCFEGMNFDANYAVTDSVKKKVVSIPIHSQLTQEELQKVTYVINTFKA
jgi:perosamine synthetase